MCSFTDLRENVLVYIIKEKLHITEVPSDLFSPVTSLFQSHPLLFIMLSLLPLPI